MSRRRDPLTAAGFINCRDCGKRSYPTDAVWLDPGSVLADYEAACDHVRTGLVVVAVAAMRRFSPDPEQGQPGDTP